ncbi:Cathepsin_B [Hexamita inflata]|uniref:Cathepsin_B n=1 Tax=Hexamita inflata TaxID=28002 RepID=A0ABP1H7A8_9EUKA
MLAQVSLCIVLQQHLEILQNIPDLTWTPGISLFLASKSQVELDALFTPKGAPLPRIHSQNIESKQRSKDVPDYIDWSKTHPECVNVVRDMKNCGSSQVFSLVSILSDLRCIQKKDAKRVQYSEQYVLNCNYCGSGCEHTGDRSVFDFVMTQGTVPDSCLQLKSDKTGYPGQCPMFCDDGSFSDTTTFKEYVEVTKDKPIFQMESALAAGPISALFEVYEDFMFYTGGIYQHKYGNFLTFHRGEIVGYDEEDGEEYWKIKFSFGPDFGENGFVRMPKGENTFQIETHAFHFIL